VSLGKGTAGSRLQITLECDRAVRVRELNGRNEMPGPVRCSVERPCRIVCLQPASHIRCQTDVVARRPRRAPKDVNEASAVLHGPVGLQLNRRSKDSEFCRGAQEPRETSQILRSVPSWESRILNSALAHRGRCLPSLRNAKVGLPSRSSG
jgi:hypothetical protein